MADDFNFFVDSLIVAAADKQDAAKLKWIPFFQLCSEVKAQSPPSWHSMAAERIGKLDCGRFSMDSDAPGGRIYKINSTGIARAAMIRAERRKPSFRDKIRSVPVGKGVWDVIKLLLAACAGAAIKTYMDN